MNTDPWRDLATEPYCVYDKPERLAGLDAPPPQQDCADARGAISAGSRALACRGCRQEPIAMSCAPPITMSCAPSAATGPARQRTCWGPI